MGVALTEEVQDLLRGSNWMPVRHIATGGGGAVYLGVNRALINAFDQHDRLIELRCAQQVGRAPPRGRDVGGPKHNVLPALAQTLDAAIRRNNIVAAVKVPKAFDQEADKKRFQREIATTGRLPHPNLIRLLDADSGDPPRWFAMDYHARSDSWPLEGGMMDPLWRSGRGEHLAVRAPVRI